MNILNLIEGKNEQGTNVKLIAEVEFFRLGERDWMMKVPGGMMDSKWLGPSINFELEKNYEHTRQKRSKNDHPL